MDDFDGEYEREPLSGPADRRGLPDPLPIPTPSPRHSLPQPGVDSPVVHRQPEPLVQRRTLDDQQVFERATRRDAGRGASVRRGASVHRDGDGHRDPHSAANHHSGVDTPRRGADLRRDPHSPAHQPSGVDTTRRGADLRRDPHSPAHQHAHLHTPSAPLGTRRPIPQSAANDQTTVTTSRRGAHLHRDPSSTAHQHTNATTSRRDAYLHRDAHLHRDPHSTTNHHSGVDTTRRGADLHHNPHSPAHQHAHNNAPSAPLGTRRPIPQSAANNQTTVTTSRRGAHLHRDPSSATHQHTNATTSRRDAYLHRDAHLHRDPNTNPWKGTNGLLRGRRGKMIIGAAAATIALTAWIALRPTTTPTPDGINADTAPEVATQDIPPSQPLELFIPRLNLVATFENKPCRITDGAIDPQTMNQACAYTADDRPYSLPGTNAPDLTVIAGHTGAGVPAVFNNLYDGSKDQHKVAEGDQMFIKTEASGEQWLVYRATDLHDPVKADLANDTAIWGEGATPGRLLTISCIQPANPLQASERNAVVGWQYAGVAAAGEVDGGAVDGGG